MHFKASSNSSAAMNQDKEVFLQTYGAGFNS